MMRRKKKKITRKRRARLARMPSAVERTWMRRLFGLLSVSSKGENEGKVRFETSAITMDKHKEDEDTQLDLTCYEPNEFRYFNCPALRCMERFFEKAALEEHVNKSHSSRRCYFKCIPHQKILFGIQGFNEHFQTLHSKDYLPCSCSGVCGQDKNFLD